MRNAIVILLLIVTFWGCTKEPQDPTMNCPAFERGMLEKNIELVGIEIDKLTEDLLPAPSLADSVGNLKNINKLSERINRSCNFSARGICYMCIPGNPPQSEIEVIFKQPNDTILMSFTLITDSAMRLKVADIF